MSFARHFAARAPETLRRVIAAVDVAPVRRTLRGYDRRRLTSDARAGINVALLAFPQAIAFAMIAGLPISFGLFGSIVAGLIGGFFGGSRFVLFGPSNATAVLTLSAFIASGIHAAEMPVLLPLLLLLVGALQITAALLNAGSLITYISRSVVVGYVSAAAVLIMANQLRNVAGVTIEDSATLLGVLYHTFAGLHATHWPTVCVSAATALVLYLLRRFAPTWPNVALVLFAAIGFGQLAEHLGYAVRMLPSVTVSNFAITVPTIDFESINRLASAALAVAFLGILECVSIGKSMAARSGERLDSNQEMFALGMSNLGCAMCGGLTASGSLTRSALNVNSGASTPAASMMCSIASLILVLGLGRVVGFVPRASLAVVVVFVALSLINPKQIRFVIRATRADAAVFFVTSGSALLFPLDTAIFVGTATSIVLFLSKAGAPELAEYAFNPEGQLAEVPSSDRRPLPQISIVHVEGSLFFGAAELLQEQIRRVCEDPNLRILVLRLKFAHHLDASAILALEELVQSMRENGRGLIVSGARKDVYRICRRTGLLSLIGRENFFVEWPQNPTLSTRNALKRAQEILGQKEADVRVF